MGDIQKYKRANVIIGSVTASQAPADVAALLAELDKFEQEVDSLSADLSQVDKSISEFRKSLDNVADAVSNFEQQFIILE